METTYQIDFTEDNTVEYINIEEEEVNEGYGRVETY